MRLAFTACVTATLFLFAAAPALAQSQINTVPGVQLPQSAVQPVVLSAQQAQLRRLQLARAAGAALPPAGLRVAATLSVNAPSVPNAYLQFYNLAYFMPHVSLYGTATMRANTAPGDISWVKISYRADAGVRYIIDCAVTGDARRFQFERLNGSPRDSRDTTTTSVSDGRVSLVTTPAAATGEVNVYLKGLDANWYFHQCELTPIR